MLGKIQINLVFHLLICTFVPKKRINAMKIGDQVRFLSEIGGGRVAGFQGKNIVLVEDEDGFQMPMLKTEVVVVGEEDYDTKHVVEAKAQSAKAAMKGSDEEEW